jgi:hypothetical protein
MAEYERHGADLERRWAELVEPSTVQNTVRAAAAVVRDTRQGAKQLSEILTRTANTLERSAELAEEHAKRRDHAGRGDDAEQERQAAERAREAAQRALSQADEWLTLIEEQ